MYTVQTGPSPGAFCHFLGLTTRKPTIKLSGSRFSRLQYYISSREYVRLLTTRCWRLATLIHQCDFRPCLIVFTARHISFYRCAVRQLHFGKPPLVNFWLRACVQMRLDAENAFSDCLVRSSPRLVQTQQNSAPMTRRRVKTTMTLLVVRLCRET